MKRFITTATVVVVGVMLATCCTADEKSKTENLMQKKLEYSSNILAGLTNEDFDLIAKNAKALHDFGKKKWLETDSPEYRTQNQVFWFTSAALLTAAENKDIDAATLSYTQMTFSCVNCHKLLRKQ